MGEFDRDDDAGPDPGGAPDESDPGPTGNPDPEVEWPVEFRGVTESLVATLGPNDRWNLAPLGLHPPERETDPVTATTWGRTRTRRNFDRRGSGVVQFVVDPVVFVDAALGIVELDDPVHEVADAWVRVVVEDRERGIEASSDGPPDAAAGTEWVEWALHPTEATVERTTVPTIARGFNAVVEATVWASRLDVPGYDETTLLDRLAFLESVVESAGGSRDLTAFDRIDTHVEWRSRR